MEYFFECVEKGCVKSQVIRHDLDEKNDKKAVNKIRNKLGKKFDVVYGYNIDKSYVIDLSKF